MRVRATRRRACAAALAVATCVVGLSLQAPPVGAATSIALRKVSPSAGWTTPVFSAWYGRDKTGNDAYSSPAVGDVNGDGIPDIVAGFPDGTVQGWSTVGGTQLFRWSTGAGAVQGSPVLVDLNKDGRLDVLVANTAGYVIGYDRSGGTIFKRRVGDGDPRHPVSVFSTPVAADIDHDGRLDVVVTSWDHHLHVYKQAGGEVAGFPYFLKDTSWSSPAVADLNGDGWADIVFGYDCDGVDGQDCAPNHGGYVTAISHLGKPLAGWPRFINQQVEWSSPALADIDGDGKLDVVIGTGLMSGTKFPGGKRILAFHANGTLVAGWPVTVGGRVMASPAIGDVNGDGRPDVVTVADDGKVYVHSGNGQLQFSRCIATNTSGCPVPLHASASVADINNDGHQEVVVAGEQWLNVYGAGGAVLSRVASASGTYPLIAAPTIVAAGAKDAAARRTWIVVSGAGKNASGQYLGRVFAWTTDTALGRSPWPLFRQGIGRTGYLPVTFR